MLKNNSKTLTSKQKRVFDYLCDCLEKNGFSPTIAELMQFLQVSSSRSVVQYLESLEKKGLIARARNCSRGITLLSRVEQELDTVILPIVSAAGCDNMNVFADQMHDEFVTIDRGFLQGCKSEKVVVFRALGDSMVDAGICSGDLVLAEMTNDIKQKDKVVAIVDGMALIKQISFSANAVILSPMSSDPQYRPIIMKRNFQVFGKVLDVIKNSIGGEELVYESL